MTSFALGDLAYYLFRPVVHVIDWCWGTDLRDCEVCKARRARWNALPYSRPLAIFVVTIAVVATIYAIK